MKASQPMLTYLKKQNNEWNMFKINNEDTRTTLLTSSGVFVVTFEQILQVFQVLS